MAADADIAFSYEQFEQLVRRFSSSMPEQCLRHRSTASLALVLQQLRLHESLDMRFTVAIVGQMRVGKSTLLNALIGRDLAPTGVTETTATINRFCYGQGDQCGIFRVHWLNHETTDVPLDEARRWIGLEENAAKTRYLEFFADSEFLKTATVIDTPGTRSVIQTHETATQGFLSEQLEATTLRYGGSADAVIYAINPVGRACDRDLLQLFGERTRLPGASAYNSIAVVQKWEHLQPHPLLEAEQKCRVLRAQLEGKVAAVIPTSGLLARQLAVVPPAIWQRLCDLCARSSPASLEAMLLSEQDFTEELPDAGLDGAARRTILEAVGWKLIPLCITLARQERISDGAQLQSRLHEASGLPLLRSLLQKHFFSRARLIKASTVLRKAWGPCETALLTLRRELEAQAEMIQRGHRAQAALAACHASDPALQAARQYVAESLAIMEQDMATLRDIQREIDGLKYRAQCNFEFFDADIECLKLLEAHRALFSPAEAEELEALCGHGGLDLWSRLGVNAAATSHDAAMVRARERFSYWSLQRQRSHGPRARICQHACDVLDLILDHLESCADDRHHRD